MSPILASLLRPFTPPLVTVRHYNVGKLRKDLVAGLTVSVVEIPQAMAYAVIAGVPPQYGIYTSIIQGIIGALLSSSEHMTTGPTNTQSLLIASAVKRLADPLGTPEVYLQLVIGLTMLKGLIQLAFALAKMGGMVRYVSRSVIAGLISGAGLLILFGQLPALLGIAARDAVEWPGVLGPIQRLVRHAHEANPRALVIGLGSLVIVLGARAIWRFLPGALLAVAASALAVAAMRWTGPDLPLLGDLPRGFPWPEVPHLNWVRAEALFGGALALAFIGMLESVAIAKTIAVRTGEHISADQEFFAQGLKNLISSFLHCIPGSGSFTRTALDYEAGGQTRFAAVFNALFVAAIFFLFATQTRYIAYASLAAVLLVIAAGLIDWRYFVRVARSSRPDALVFGITLLATLLLPLEYAIFIGVFLNVGLYLRQAARLHLSELVETTGGPFMERPVQDRTGAGSQIVFLQAEGDLFFGVADELRDRLTALNHSGVRVVVLRLKRTLSMDATVLHVLEGFARELQARGGYLLLCGVKPELSATLRAYGLVKLLGAEHVFEARLGIFASAKAALQCARRLVSEPVPKADPEAATAPEALMYMI